MATEVAEQSQLQECDSSESPLEMYPEDLRDDAFQCSFVEYLSL